MLFCSIYLCIYSTASWEVETTSAIRSVDRNGSISKVLAVRGSETEVWYTLPSRRRPKRTARALPCNSDASHAVGSSSLTSSAQLIRRLTFGALSGAWTAATAGSTIAWFGQNSTNKKEIVMRICIQNCIYEKTENSVAYVSINVLNKYIHRKNRYCHETQYTKLFEYIYIYIYI